MFVDAGNSIIIELADGVLPAVFDECDRYDADESGGRLLGIYKRTGGVLKVTVTGIIEPGPNAHRTATSFVPDREHQARVFRRVERDHPEIEHLGNWHTHHVNGLDHLSGGDIETYRRTVNHELHNLDFFIALLVTNRRKRGERYDFKAYALKRDDAAVYEIPARNIGASKLPLVWPQPSRIAAPVDEAGKAVQAVFPGAAPFHQGAETGWAGPIQLADGRKIQLELVEDAGQYRISSVTDDGVETKPFAKERFAIAAQGFHFVERRLNRALWLQASAHSVTPQKESRQTEPKAKETSMEIITVNVGQGALAIVRDQDEAVIVDSRIPPSGDSSVAFVKGALATHLKGFNVRGLLLTGFDADHADAAGVALVLRKYQPEWVMYPSYWKDTEEADNVFALIDEQVKARAGSSRPLHRIGIRLDKLPSRHMNDLCTRFNLELLSPHTEDMNCSNNCSIVCKISAKSGGFSYLVTGDTENGRWETINKLFGGALAADVIAVPHHGSKNGTNAKTVQLVSPKTALISAGKDNQYGHPDGRVVKVYEAVSAVVHSTHASNGKSLFTRYRGKFETVLVD